MGAAELLDYDRERIRGLVLEEGGPTSHVTIVARALGIATVGQAAQRRLAGRERRRRSSSTAIAGEVHLRPPADVEAAYAEKVRFRARRQEQYRLLRDKPAVTRDGQRVDAADECRPARRPAASRRSRARRASACSAPSCSS